MQKLIIHKLGPIEDCNLEISDMLVLTGEQASGKSTIAKSIFFFKNLLKLLEDQARRMMFLGNEEKSLPLRGRWKRIMEANFQQTFGPIWRMDKEMVLEYFYTEDLRIKICFPALEKTPDFLWIDLSEEIVSFLTYLEGKWVTKKTYEVDYRYQNPGEEVAGFFEDDLEPVYIPAGRSMLTLLSGQLSYIYGAMDDVQKRELDYCTQNYLEKIMRLKTFFNYDYQVLIQQTVYLSDKKVDEELCSKAAEFVRKILQGEYCYADGDERLKLTDEHYVKINFASSGQQETVWILNVLFYYLLNGKKAYFIIEEPESHLFPNAQKLMTEFISLAKAGHNQVLVTTHSPYVLGTLNNLLYAHETVGQADKEKMNEIINERCWISPKGFQAFFVKDGCIENCVDDEIAQIRNEVIDGASMYINEDFDKMVELRYQEDVE